MDGYLHTKTVVGDPIQVGDKIILPLSDVSFGIGAGALEGSSKNRGGGGMGAKISASALLVIDKDGTKLVSLKDSSTIGKLFELAPRVINRFMNKGEEASEEAAPEEESGEQI